MPNLLTRTILFLSSYTPLLMIMAVKFHLQHPYISLALGGIGVLSIIILLFFLRVARRLGRNVVTIERATAKDGDAMSYIVTYLIPFLDIKLDEPSSYGALLLLFFVVGVLYVNSNMIYINPMLNLFGYHIFEIDDKDGKASAIISRKDYVDRGAQINVVSLGNQVVMEVSNASRAGAQANNQRPQQ